MKIVIDARMYGPRKWTGIGRYIQEMIRELENIDQTNTYIVLLNRENFDEYQPGSTNFSKRLAPYNPYTFGEQLRLAWQLYRLRPDLVHFCAFNSPLLYLRRHVVTIHDLTLLNFRTSRYTGFKRLLQGYKYLPFKLALWWRAKSARLIIVPSQYVKDGLVARYHLRPDKVQVTLESFNPLMAKPQAPTPKVDSPFLYYAGTYHPNKNVAVLIQALALLTKNQPDLKLVLSGRNDYFTEQTLALAKQLGVSDRVDFRGYVSDGELVWLYQHCAAFIFPSLSEGFGLPGLEALAQNAPLIAAEASCFPEIYEDAAVYFAPHKPEDLAAKITTVLQDGQLREDLAKRGRQRVKDFSWQTMAEQTHAAYQEAIHN